MQLGRIYFVHSMHESNWVSPKGVIMAIAATAVYVGSAS